MDANQIADAQPAPSPTTQERAVAAFDAMADALISVRDGHRDAAVEHIEKVVHLLAHVLTEYGLEIGEVLPTVTCSTCKRPCVDYRRITGHRVCILCQNEHIRGVLAEPTPADVKLREVTGLLTDLVRPAAQAVAYLDRERAQ